MNLLLVVPDVLARQILAVWLPFKAVASLDVSFCSRSTRNEYLDLVGPSQSAYCTFDGAPTKFNSTSSRNLQKWLINRTVHVSNLKFCDESRTGDLMNAATMSYFDHCGSTIKQLTLKVANNCIYSESLLRRCKNLEKLKLCYHTPCTFAILRSLAEHCPHLSHLECCGLFEDDETCNDPFTLCGLRSFIFGLKENDDWSRALSILSAATPHLEQLTIHNAGHNNTLAVTTVGWKKLKSLEFGDSFLSDEFVMSFLVHGQHLRELSLHGDDFTNQTMFTIAGNCPNLVHLRVINESCDLDAGLCAVVTRCPKLTHLRLHLYLELWEPTRTLMQALVQHGANLTHLILPYNIASDHDLWQSVAVRCTQLKKVLLWECGAEIHRVLADRGIGVITRAEACRWWTA